LLFEDGPGIRRALLRLRERRRHHAQDNGEKRSTTPQIEKVERPGDTLIHTRSRHRIGPPLLCGAKKPFNFQWLAAFFYRWPEFYDITREDIVNFYRPQ
jgi:hypothetical protein